MIDFCLTFAGFRKLMAETRPLTSKELLTIEDYFCGRRDDLERHERIAKDIRLELTEAAKLMERLP